MHINQSLMLDWLGPDILVVFWMKGQILHQRLCIWRVPVGCWILVCFWLDHLFLLHLRDTIGGNENTLLVSGSFSMIFKVLRMRVFRVELHGWKVRVYGIHSFFSFFRDASSAVSRLTLECSVFLCWPQSWGSHVIRELQISLPFFCGNQSHH